MPAVGHVRVCFCLVRPCIFSLKYQTHLRRARQAWLKKIKNGCFFSDGPTLSAFTTAARYPSQTSTIPYHTIPYHASYIRCYGPNEPPLRDATHTVWMLRQDGVKRHTMQLVWYGCGNGQHKRCLPPPWQPKVVKTSFQFSARIWARILNLFDTLDCVGLGNGMDQAPRRALS